jgi:hypothetical protein
MKRKIAHQKWQITHGSMSWEGATSREVDDARDRTLDRRFGAFDVAPGLVTAGSFVGVVWQCHNGDFSYLIRGLRFPERVEHGNHRLTAGCPSHGAWSRLEAERRMRRDLAEKVYGEGEDDGLGVIAKDDAEGIALHRRWTRFQDEFKRLTKEGVPESEAHYRAVPHI